MTDTGKLVVLMTCADEEESEEIAYALINEKLAACVNIIPKIKSVYRFEGSFCCDSEVLMIAKTSQAKFDLLKKRVTEIHSYKLPEVIALPVSDGLKGYLDWIDESLFAE
jgi:periplasmic divalent cation tolerance protein